MRNPKGPQHPSYRHGHALAGNKSPTYTCWLNMKKRCNNWNNSDYKNYGARGIAYDPNWESFDQFLEDMGERPNGLTLDRIDNDGDYTPDNCRWASRKTQRLNRRSMTWVTVNGKRLCLRDVCKVLGISRVAVYHRKKNGWSLFEALITPKGGRWSG